VKALRTVGVILSALLLGAHFLRSGQLFLVILCLALPLLLFVSHHRAGTALRAVLFLGALEWVRTAAFLMRDRLIMGEPWLRMVIILGIVSLFTLGAALLARTGQTQS
jgi:hypothetical protein